MAALKTLKNRLAIKPTHTVRVLEAKAGTTERIRGDTWMKVRRRVLLAGGYACVDCGLVNASNEIDHDVPLEQGGSNDDANLRIRCLVCHKAKSAREAGLRSGQR